jgi:hypothetical protein
MALFNVIVSYVATRKTRGGGKIVARAESDRVALVVVADSPEEAESKATAWFEAQKSAPTCHIMFGNGLRDATSVRLAEGSKLGPAVKAFAIDGDVAVV